MQHSMTPFTDIPDTFSDADLQRFKELVIKGDEVGGAVLTDNIARARILAIYREESLIVGVAALIFLPSRAPELNPVENVWEYLRQNWLSNTVFDSDDAIIDAPCDAWQKLLAAPEAITSIGMRKWAHIGQTQ